MMQKRQFYICTEIHPLSIKWIKNVITAGKCKVFFITNFFANNKFYMIKLIGENSSNHEDTHIAHFV